jgi:uncharacterized protein YqgV (UPF0045/DUF77 family)
MDISVEISYYPLADNYLDRIETFIQQLRKYPSVKVMTNGMSTQIFGTYDEVMHILQQELKQAMLEPHAVFVLKVVNACCDSYTPR